jgi:drug/metabolite transporter (DMT)-like permease
MIDEGELVDAPPRKGAVVGGVLILWIGWGSVYAAMATSAETIPPLLATGVRFMLAGCVLGALGGARRVSADLATRREWRSAATLGFLCILIGTGGIVVSVKYVASGTVALLAATAPMWVALVERFWLRRTIPPRSVVGLLVGFAGTTLLVTQGGSAAVDLGWGRRGAVLGGLGAGHGLRVRGAAGPEPVAGHGDADGAGRGDGPGPGDRGRRGG